MAALIAASVVHAEIRTDFVFASDFEPTPQKVFPRIEFVGDRNLTFSTTGQTRGVEVRVFDANGHPIPAPAIVWESIQPASASVTAGAAGTATATSVSAWSGPFAITARYPPLGLQADASAVFATLASRTVLIESDWVQTIFGDRGGTHRIGLQRNTVTESLNADDIVASGDYAGIVVRVRSVQVGADGVQLEVEPALITEAFQSVQFGGSGEEILLSVKITGDSGELAVRSKRSGALLQSTQLSKADVRSLLQCEGGLNGSAGVEIGTLSLEQSLVPRGGLRIEDYAVVDFLLLVEGSAGIEAGVSIEATGALNLSGKCEARLPSIALGWFPFLGPLAASFNAVPTAGVTASVGASGSATAQATFDRAYAFRAGVRYTDAGGWTTIAESSASSAEVDDSLFDVEGAFKAEVGATLGIAAEAKFTLGAPGLGFTLLGTRLAELNGGPYRKWELPLPTDPLSVDYQGPSSNIGVKAAARLGLSKKLFEGALSKYLPLQLDADIGLSFLEEDFVFWRLPAVTGNVQCSPGCSALEPGTGQFTATLSAETTDTGVADFYLGAARASTLTLLGSADFSSGQASYKTVVPGNSTGQYRVYGRLRLYDELAGLTDVFPLAPAQPLGSINAGRCASDSTVVDEDLLACFEDGALRQCVADSHIGRPIVNVTYLFCPSNGIASLAGIETLTASFNLDLSYNQIKDVTALGSLTALTFLSLEGNQIENVSALETLTALTDLGLHNNQITDVSALGSLGALTSLTLDNNQVVDVSALGGLTELAFLGLNTNAINDVGALGSLTELTSLRLNGNQVTDVSVLGNLTALTSLVLQGNQIADVSALGNLTALNTLSLGSNQITDVIALGSLTKLTNLWLYDNQIADVSVLGSLTALTDLRLHDNQIADVSMLGKLTALTHLGLDGNQIADVKALGNLTDLIGLSLNNNQITDVSALGNLTALTHLGLNNNQITDVSVLDSLTALTYLRLDFNHVDGLNTISCASAIALYEALGMPDFIGCRCDCSCGPRNGMSTESCKTICVYSCPVERKQLDFLKSRPE